MSVYLRNVMVDIETLGVSNNAAILSIGAVFFDPLEQKLGEPFYQEITLDSNTAAGRNIEGRTLKWWVLRNFKLFYDLINRNYSVAPLRDALTKLGAFLHQSDVQDGVEVVPIVWSKGPTFDVVLLQNAYEQLSMAVPWQFRNVRDVRTIEALTQGVISPHDVEYSGTKHYALSDAIFQATYVSLMWATLRSGLVQP